MIIRSEKFQPLCNEDKEIVNPGMYGKALAEYLRHALENDGYEIEFVCPEDFGWWIEIFGMPFILGVMVCRSQERGEENLFACAASREPGQKAWSWRHLRRISTSPLVDQLLESIYRIFMEDKDVEIVSK